VISYIRAGLVLAVLSLTAWGGWTARAWLEDSRALDQAKQERDAAIARERAAETKATEVETARAKIAGELATERAKIHADTAPIIKRIPVYVDRGACNISVDGVRALNSARGAILPNAERRIAGETITRRADPGL
jgi:hypothetical protein